MMYAILCYDREADIAAWTKDEDDAVMTKLFAVQEGWKAAGRLGPVGRLEPTKQAKTLRKGGEQRGQQLVVDGPFAETKEALLGFYVLDCASMDEAVDAARELAAANPSNGTYEIRPFLVLRP